MSGEHTDSPEISKNVHPPFVALFYLVAGLILQKFIPIPFEISVTAKTAGLGLALIGVLLGLSAFMEFRKVQTTLDPHGSVKTLVTDGIYRFTRNPIYLGFFLMVIGFPLNYGSLWGLVAAPFFATTLSRLVIEKEEAYLKRKFKKQYTNYSLRVRRWL